MVTPLKNVHRCQAPLGGAICESSIFYDWGIQVMEKSNGTTITGAESKFKDYSHSSNVFICARCNTPYIKLEGDLVDISEELGAEDVKAIISRGQQVLPHPKQKDP